MLFLSPSQSRRIGEWSNPRHVAGPLIHDPPNHQKTENGLSFVDNPLFFCEDNVDQLKYWKWIVSCFELVLGLRINMQKGEIIPMGEADDVDRVTSLFGCKVGKLPISYIGLFLEALHKLFRVWISIEERFKRKLVAWKK